MSSYLSQNEQQQPTSGVLLIRVCEARGITLPPLIQLPESVLAGASLPIVQRNKRESFQKKLQTWWLPYIVLEFDKNEILIDAIGGDVFNPIYNYRATFDVSCYSKVSMSIYIRQQQNQQQQTSQGNGSNNDIFLGSIKIQPDFSSISLEEQLFNIVGGTGAMYLQLCYTPQQHRTISFDSFDLLRVIGRGSFGKVYVVRKKDTNRIYAMKVLRKSKIISRSEVTHTMAEKTVLAKVRNPFIVPLKFAFQSPDKLYLVLAFINGGELFHHLQVEGRFNEERARFYTAELFCALQCLHGFNVVYRDLKPENILIDYNGHIALCDFGLCKLLTATERTNTFCGTPEYLAPELLIGEGYTKAVDWWTLGVLLYEMITGLPPFYDENTNEMYRKILQDPLRFPDDVSEPARDLLTRLLNRDPDSRLGYKSTDEIRNHPFFASIDWTKLMKKQLQPPFKPSVESIYDTTNFDEEFTSEQPVESVNADGDSHLSKTMQDQFKGFTFNAEGIMTDSYNSYQQASNLTTSFTN
ncbi:kinase-like domain-containing protein [Mycotypha africana]|uniref:kinase-like domain-containing protein n=1 Tax=Mycotypha africana TaxID=64632 RepID=UPI00230030FB|nr:kinase-like domain-containing protein [Mycotypha africana]KAI8979745.1 kinase-like domain-containing protein [Mycotypha africana]